MLHITLLTTTEEDEEDLEAATASLAVAEEISVAVLLEP